MKDIMREFLSQRHLLDGIAKSEGLRGFYYDWENGYEKYLGCKKSVDNEKTEEYGKIKFHVLNLGKIGNKNASSEWNYDLNNLDESIAKRKDKFKNKEEKLIASENKEKYLRILLNSDEKGEIEPNIEEGDIQIAIPGGIIGYHAFYVIVENIIRNSAKHSYTKMKELLKEWAELKLYLNSSMKNKDKECKNREKFDKAKEILNIKNEEECKKKIEKLKGKYKSEGNNKLRKDLSEKEQILKRTFGKEFYKMQDLEIMIEFTDDPLKPDEMWLFRIYDNVSKINGKRLPGKGQKRFRAFPEGTPEGEVSPEKDLVAYMNWCLRHSVIKETGELDKRHWGMAEMKIAAGYLQGREIQDIGAEGDKITGSLENQNADKEDFIIRAVESPIGTLGFEFKVRKPREVGIVCYKEGR